MINVRTKNILVSPNTTIRKAMEIINAAPLKGAPAGIALVVGESNKLSGVVTDGDIRRTTLSGVGIDTPVEEIMIRDPVTVTKGLSSSKMIKEVLRKVKETKRIRDSKVDKIIIVDEQNRVEDVISFFELWKRSEIKIREVCIIGLGYVGLTLGISLADIGFKVVGVDRNKEVIQSLLRGNAHFHEVGLNALLEFHVNKSFFIKEELDSEDSDVYIICVDTPIGRERKAEMKNFEDACLSVGKILKKDDLVIVRSTVPVGTCRNVVLPILEKSSALIGGGDFYLACAPERTVAGKALEELRKLPQIVGGLDTTSAELTSNLFRNLTPTIVNVDSIEVAEMIKLIDNTFRDFIFAYPNELALICDRLNLDTVELIRAANEGYSRNRIPLPSPGVGGSCLTKDTYIFMEIAARAGGEAKLTRVAREINEYMPVYVAEKIANFCKANEKDLSEVKIFIIGFAFKGEPETSDTRKSSTLDLIKHLKTFNEHIKISGYDPVVSSEEIKKIGVIPCTLETGFENADCVVIMNNHKSYANMDIYRLLSKMNKQGLFFDGWHIFSREVVTKVEGVVYDGLGVG
jgi:nucleotide sugar dehydrogenase